MMFQNLLRFEVVYSISALSLSLEHELVTVFICFASGRPSPWIWWRRFRLLQCCWVASSCWPVYHGCCGQHWAQRHYGSAMTSCSRSVTACMQSWTLCVSVRHSLCTKTSIIPVHNTIFIKLICIFIIETKYHLSNSINYITKSNKKSTCHFGTLMWRDRLCSRPSSIWSFLPCIARNKHEWTSEGKFTKQYNLLKCIMSHESRNQCFKRRKMLSKQLVNNVM